MMEHQGLYRFFFTYPLLARGGKLAILPAVTFLSLLETVRQKTWSGKYGPHRCRGCLIWPQAADGSMRTFTGGRCDFGRFSAFVDQDVTPARENQRIGSHTEAGRTRRSKIDRFCRTAISILRLIYCSVFRTLTSFLVSWYVCLRGKTWMSSCLIKAC